MNGGKREGAGRKKELVNPARFCLMIPGELLDKVRARSQKEGVSMARVVVSVLEKEFILPK